MATRGGNSLDLMQVFGAIKGLVEQSRDKRFLNEKFPALTSQISPQGNIPPELAARAGQSDPIQRALATFLEGPKSAAGVQATIAGTEATRGQEGRAAGDFSKLGGISPQGLNAQTTSKDFDFRKLITEKEEKDFTSRGLGPTASTAQAANQQSGQKLTGQIAGQQGMAEIMKLLTDPAAQLGGGGMLQSIMKLFSGGQAPTDPASLLKGLGQQGEQANAAKKAENQSIMQALENARNSTQTVRSPTETVPMAGTTPMRPQPSTPMKGPSPQVKPGQAATVPSGFEHLFQRQPGQVNPQSDALRQQIEAMMKGSLWQTPGGFDQITSMSPEQLQQLPPEMQQLIQQYINSLSLYGPK